MYILPHLKKPYNKAGIKHNFLNLKKKQKQKLMQ